MRIIAFSIIFISALFLPLWIFAIGACMYALRYSPFELLVVAVCVDAQFGDWQRQGYLYTAAVSGIILITYILRPYLTFTR